MENLKHALHFLTKFLHRPRHVGAILPSSSYLARAMLKDLQFESDQQTVLELGPGTGPFTKVLAEILPNPQQYLAIDRESSFIDLLRKKIPNFRFVHGQAEDMYTIWQTAMPSAPSVILSSLPFANFDEALQDKILQSLVDLARPGTVFRTFQYAFTFHGRKAARFREKMNARFGPEQSRRHVWFNLPPAYVVSWVKA